MKKTTVKTVLAVLFLIVLSSSTALADGSVPEQCCIRCSCIR